jgi:autotransporter-associated beta strand protein
VDGKIQGAASLTKIGSGSLLLAGANTYTGATTVNAGTLVLDGINALPLGSPLTIAAGATVILQNGAPIPNYAGAGIVTRAGLQK